QQAVGLGGRQVLERVHQDVALPAEQRLPQAGGEDAHPADLGQRCTVRVAFRDDGNELDLAAGDLLECGGDVAGLRLRECASARAEADRTLSGRSTHHAYCSTSAISSKRSLRPVKNGTSSFTKR